MCIYIHTYMYIYIYMYIYLYPPTSPELERVLAYSCNPQCLPIQHPASCKSCNPPILQTAIVS